MNTSIRQTNRQGIIILTIEKKYTPCITDKNGRILKAVGLPCTKIEAENILKTNYYQQWINCGGVPVLSSNKNIDEFKLFG